MLELQPGKCNSRVSIFKGFPAIPYLANEDSTVIQESRSMMQDHVDRIQTVVARRKSECRLMPELVGS